MHISKYADMQMCRYLNMIRNIVTTFRQRISAVTHSGWRRQPSPLVLFPDASHADDNEGYLREQAVEYGPEAEIDALLHYLEIYGEIRNDRLPE